MADRPREKGAESPAKVLVRSRPVSPPRLQPPVGSANAPRLGDPPPSDDLADIDAAFDSALAELPLQAVPIDLGAAPMEPALESVPRTEGATELSPFALQAPQPPRATTTRPPTAYARGPDRSAAEGETRPDRSAAEGETRPEVAAPSSDEEGMSPAIARLIAEAAANPKGFNPASGHTMLLSHPNARTQQSPSSPPAPLPTTHSPSRPPMPTPTPHATATASYGPPPGMQAHAHARMPGMPGMPMPMQMQMPQMGSAPPVRPGIVLTGPPDPRLVLVNEPGSARATSFRVLRDNLLARGLPRVLAVSSAAKGDGKTTCAVNLALSLSERARVLLLDGNFAEPGLTALFEITELTPVSRLHGPWLAPYTVVDLSPTLAVSTLLVREGMASPRFEKWAFEQLIVSLRRMPIDFVIIDTAAVSTSPSVGQLLGSVDATLLTVRAGVTTARALRRATDVIPEGRGIGIALVDTNPG